jgi:hypothetical protein
VVDREVLLSRGVVGGLRGARSSYSVGGFVGASHKPHRKHPPSGTGGNMGS